MGLPNFIFILIDDMGWKDLACYGSGFYETPNLDRLAAEGMRFTDAYAACPVCSPTRASILTGRYPARVGITDWIDWAGGVHPIRGKLIDAPYLRQLPRGETTIASVLSLAGYRTWHVGKWHLGGPEFFPEAHGFDVNVAGCQWGHPRNGYFSPWGFPNFPDGPEAEYLTDRLTDEAIRLIEGNDGAPFFLNLWYYAVHTPIQAKTEHMEKYRAKAHDLGLDRMEAFEAGDFFPTEKKRHRRVTRRRLQSDPTYAAMVENLDLNIGRLLAALDEAGRAGDTLVFFTSDNGGLSTIEKSPTCNAPLAEGKGWMYEGGTREPLIARWPGVIRPGSLCRAPVTSPDFFPTLLEAAGLDPQPERHRDGVSILPLLRQAGSLDREDIFWHYPHYGNQGGTPGSSIRSGHWKLIEFLEEGKLELYNLQEDISERRNLTDDMPDLAKELHARLAKWRGEVGARIPEKNPEWMR